MRTYLENQGLKCPVGFMSDLEVLQVSFMTISGTDGTLHYSVTARLTLVVTALVFGTGDAHPRPSRKNNLRRWRSASGQVWHWTVVCTSDLANCHAWCGRRVIMCLSFSFWVHFTTTTTTTNNNNNKKMMMMMMMNIIIPLNSLRLLLPGSSHPQPQRKQSN